VILGHTGLSQWEKALPLAKEFEEHVWLDVSGQHAGILREILDNYDRNRIVFGSDWPYYPLAVALARLLVATEGRPDWRAGILHNNAAALLRL
jgi:predicted TIM-barrel fold metal-dependent hydrolase